MACAPVTGMWGVTGLGSCGDTFSDGSVDTTGCTDAQLWEIADNPLYGVPLGKGNASGTSTPLPSTASQPMKSSAMWLLIGAAAFLFLSRK